MASLVGKPQKAGLLETFLMFLHGIRIECILANKSANLAENSMRIILHNVRKQFSTIKTIFSEIMLNKTDPIISLLWF